MRTETRNIYTAAELKTLNDGGAAFENALNKYRETRAQSNCDWSDEICGSGRETVKAAGLTLRDWMVDQSNPSSSFYKIEGFGEDSEGREISDYTGRKAREWISAAFAPKIKLNWRGKEPGNCPFTGYCADDSCLDALKKSIKDGETLKEAFENLAYVVAKICESESEYEASEEGFLSFCEGNEWEFDEHGNRI